MRKGALALVFAGLIAAQAADIEGSIVIKRKLTKRKVTATASSYERGVAGRSMMILVTRASADGPQVANAAARQAASGARNALTCLPNMKSPLLRRVAADYVRAHSGDS